MDVYYADPYHTNPAEHTIYRPSNKKPGYWPRLDFLLRKISVFQTTMSGNNTNVHKFPDMNAILFYYNILRTTGSYI